MKSMLFPIFFLASLSAIALPNESALRNYVPGGKIIQTKQKEIKVLTPADTVVEIEFEANGDFEEASGDNLDHDIFIPGEGLLSLADAVASARKARKNILGDWSLEKTFLSGWVYEFDGIDGMKKMEYSVDAKTGKILSEKIDD